MKKTQLKGKKEELKLFPETDEILQFIEQEKYPTISSISRRFKMHRMTASEIVGKLKQHGYVMIEPIGSAKIIKKVGT